MPASANQPEASPARQPNAEAVLRGTPAGGAMPSPCAGICRMDAGSSLCLGCWRTLEEIAHWSAYSPEQQRACWQRIAARSFACVPLRA